MAGVVGMSGGQGGKKPVDAEIHLVPLIDLLCSLISFLLMTAVWSQISRLELKNGSDAPQEEQQQETPPDEKKMVLKVHIHSKGFTVIEQSTEAQTQIPCTAPECFRVETTTDGKGMQRASVVSFYDYKKLETALAAEKAKFTNQKDVSIVLGDEVPYNEMIKTMDTCLAVGLDGIGLSGTML